VEARTPYRLVPPARPTTPGAATSRQFSSTDGPALCLPEPRKPGTITRTKGARPVPGLSRGNAQVRRAQSISSRPDTGQNIGYSAIPSAEGPDVGQFASFPPRRFSCTGGRTALPRHGPGPSTAGLSGLRPQDRGRRNGSGSGVLPAGKPVRLARHCRFARAWPTAWLFRQLCSGATASAPRCRPQQDDRVGQDQPATTPSPGMGQARKAMNAPQNVGADVR